MNTKQLRQKILDLAIKGKLVPQDPNNEPASKLLERIREEKERLINEGKLKRDKNESYIFVGDDKLHYEKFADGSIVCIEDEIPFEIPESWAWCRLKNVCIINPKNRPDDNMEAGFIPMSLISQNYLESVMFQKKTWNEIKKGFTHFQNNDVVVAKITPCFENSKAAIISNLPNNLGAGTTELQVIRPIKLLSEYIYAIIKTRKFLESGKQEMTGCAGQQRVPVNFIEEYLIPIPPIDEQQRITQTIKELLSIVESLENNKVDLSELITQTKSKVLDLAIKGKLVPQDSNDEPADKLLERIREEKEKLIKEGKLKRDKNETYIFKNSDDNSYYEQIDGETVCIDDDLPFEIPDSWRWCKLRNIGQYKKGPFGSALTKSIFVPKSENAIKVYEQKNAIQKDASLGSYYITNEYYESKMKSFTVFPGEIIVSCAGTIGETYILPSNIEKGIINQALMKISLTESMNVNYFLNYFDFILKREAIENSQGTAIKNIPPFDVLKEMYIAIPPINEQNRVVEKIENIFTYLDNLETIIKGS